jgi:hypothetical protein
MQANFLQGFAQNSVLPNSTFEVPTHGKIREKTHVGELR